MKRYFFSIGIFLTVATLAFSALSVRASSHLQTFITPTPGADGRIIFIVQEGQNCSIISNLTGIPISQLRSLNQLNDSCILNIGQELVIGIYQPPGPSATPTSNIPTPTPLPPSPTPSQPDATVCVMLYDDVNGDALHQDTEATIANGAISVTGTSGQYSQTTNTTTSVDPVCFEKIIQGTYNISVAAPDGYNPTTQQNYTLEIKSGEQIYVDFGAQLAGAAKPSGTTNPAASSNLLGVAGGVLILIALGLGVYAWLVYGRKPKTGLYKPPKN